MRITCRCGPSTGGPDEGLVAQLVDMGFPLEGCKRAVYNTKNQGVEPAMEWVLQHMDDPGRRGRVTVL